MAPFQTLSIFTFVLLTLAFPFAKAATFEVRNDCFFTVWVAASPGGGRQLDLGETWYFNVSAGTAGARIWARTGCNFDEAGSGSCQTGDCGGVLECTGYGQPPNTLVEYAHNQFNNMDFFDISLVEGFNVPMAFSPKSTGCARGIRCTGDINGQCPDELRAPAGCNNPCTVFKTDEYCCNSGSCGPTNYSKFFKDRCPDAYSYPKDDQTSTFTCPGGTNYEVVFCPNQNTSALTIAQMHIQNNCSYTVWAAANPGGGRRLNQGEKWTLNVTQQGRIWGRTNCYFDENGVGKCDSGDCNGHLQCQTEGRAPNTLAEYLINEYGVAYLDISLVKGFNVPMEISPTEATSTYIKCTADVNERCPMELRDPGGCNNPCTVFRNDQFCCHSTMCEPTNYSKFFKDLCPNAISYPSDNAEFIVYAAGSSDYNITFCP